MSFQVLTQVLPPRKRRWAENAPVRLLTSVSSEVPLEFSPVHESHATFIARQLPSTVSLEVPVQGALLRKGH